MEKEIPINQFNKDLLEQIRIHNKLLGTYTTTNNQQYYIYHLNDEMNIHISQSLYFITNLPF